MQTMKSGKTLYLTSTGYYGFLSFSDWLIWPFRERKLYCYISYLQTEGDMLLFQIYNTEL